MRFALGIIFAIVVGLALGGGSALVLTGVWPPGIAAARDAPVNVGGWQTDPTIGSQAANPYTRARVAVQGLLALANTEAMYFRRATDDSGRELSEACTYRISGTGQPARWWSITLYAADNFLPMNTDDALSIDATELGDGEWSAVIAPFDPPGDTPWLSSRNAGAFDLTLRLYVPDEALLADPEAALDPPGITRLDCGEDA